MNQRFTKHLRCFSVFFTLLLSCISITVRATTCENAIGITLPVAAGTAVACGTSNDINFGNAATCGFMDYLGGQEAVYVFVAEGSGNITIEYSGQSWSGVFVFDGCPTGGGNCIAAEASGSFMQTVNVSVVAGQTYYVVFDTWPFPESPCPGTFSISAPPLAPACNAIPGSIVAAAPPSVCGSTGFSITLGGIPEESGFTFQWYSSPSGAGTFTPIANAIYSNAGVSQNEATDYYCEMTCTASGQSVTSNTVSVSMNAAMDCMCIPQYNEGCLWGAEIEFFSLGSMGNMTAGSCSNFPAGYSDFTSISTDLMQGLSYEANITVGNYGDAGVAVWIDFNDNGVFESSEKVGYVEYLFWTGSSVSTTFPINIPLTAPTGVHRMRVRMGEYESGLSITPCNSIWSGETEDYSVNIIPAVYCTGAPTAGFISGPASVCALNPFMLTLSGQTVAVSISVQWQESPAGANTWTDIPGATVPNFNYIAGITEPMDFRCMVTCDASGQSAVSNVISVGLNGALDCYCIPEYGNGCMWGYEITNVNLESIDNNSSGDCSVSTPIGYSDYTYISTDLMQGVSYLSTVNVNNPGATMGIAMWIDLNNDGFFDVTEKLGVFPVVMESGSSTVTSIDIPSNAPLGPHRMRVRLVAYEFSASIDPCIFYWDGEAEDYMINIIPQPSCTEVSFPTDVNAHAAPASLCGSGEVTLSLNLDMPIATDITYQWQSATSESGPFTNIGAESSSPTLVYNTSNSSWYSCQILCNGSLVLNSMPVYVEAVGVEMPVVNEGQNCGPGEVTLTGSVASGTIFWYENPVGGTPVASGDIFVTPFLNATTTYYAAAGAFPSIYAPVGAGSSSANLGDVSPFTYNAGGYKHQYIITAEELIAMGATAGTINSIGLDVVNNGSSIIFNDFSISVGTTSATQFTGSWISTGLVNVFPPTNYQPTTGINTFTFTSPINWDGASNIVIQTCFNNQDWGNVSVSVKNDVTPNPMHMYGYSYGSSADQCDLPDNGPYQQSRRPQFYFDITGCETTRQPVNAYIRDFPVVNLGPDAAVCGDASQQLTLDAGNPGSTYIWDDGSTNQTRTISESGTYYVTVTNEYGCVTSDTTQKELLLSPFVNLGPDTTICDGVTLTLDAGDQGVAYYWSTGATTPTITVEFAGTYVVIVTNEQNCTVADTIIVTMNGEMPSIDAILVTNTGPYTFHFDVYNPQGAITEYTWDFGDGTPVSHALNPVHTYDTPGNYTVTLTLNTQDCGLLNYFSSIHIVGIGDVTVEDQTLKVYPNPARETITIENNGNRNMEALSVINALGQVIYTEKNINPHIHTLNLSGYASGLYAIHIKTDRGLVIRKFEVVK